mmetsp:Transcript_18534/g.28608  ORF Transcript_18534/g.28608 Transcript_18534/m.28608 type:complete len:89 (+) Transcript_18534:203-469(+)|eukprot:CAMPEP_0195295362 /NCGR_PEP_ID=MMETSP0707-20130614/17190_1 /TAXON_ID=33640 /ORGANISM="Asterionellopsis glacialis, Strain CCMP134" /LENGTH=88 /DNA_ID=CAMNT_0040356571 /DNA_START=123 /DNA_END=389 /DNA_ORIENTATION=+
MNNGEDGNNGNHNHDGDVSLNDNTNRTISDDAPPPLSSEEIPSPEAAEALEEMIREETLRHLEAAWEAQRRLARSCFAVKHKKAEHKR